ncbi:hypothetical protein FsymDg_1409 [Candidatus Protofrankia datiscae]|uniref:Uncharacterized protein n=1 Tax=Candidatus Protofrankia datiscae TaxID=2716812 RepID=F8B209_9ACTN|nr:hypothetical protein FsymDg_1409 [Candidatus Protofrankia datiscae]
MTAHVDNPAPPGNLVCVGRCAGRALSPRVGSLRENAVRPRGIVRHGVVRPGGAAG